MKPKQNCKTINHRDLELEIQSSHRCGPNCCHKQVVGCFLYDNSIYVVEVCGCDEFVVTNSWRGAGLSQSIQIYSKHIVIGDPATLRFVHDNYTSKIPGPTITPVLVDITEPHASRVMFAGAERIYVDISYQNLKVLDSPEFIRARRENRVIVI